MLYEVTLTLKPFLYSLSPKDQFLLTKIFLDEVFLPYPKVTCVAELTMEHNVHYHAIIELPNGVLAKDRFLNRFRKYRQFGRKSCTQVQYIDSFKRYIVKDLKRTEQIIAWPVVRDFFALTSMKFLKESEEIAKTLLKESLENDDEYQSSLILNLDE